MPYTNDDPLPTRIIDASTGDPAPAGATADLQTSANTLLTETKALLDAGFADTTTINTAADTTTIYEGDVALVPKFAPIQASSSGVNVVVAAVTGKKIRVLAFKLNGAGAVNAKWITDTAGTPVDLTGLTYIGAAGQGEVGPFCPVGLFQSASGKNLGLNLSGAVAVGGYVVYVEVT